MDQEKKSQEKNVMCAICQRILPEQEALAAGWRANNRKQAICDKCQKKGIVGKVPNDDLPARREKQQEKMAARIKKANRK